MKRRSAAPRITPELIAAEAIELLHTEGLDGISLRRLAAQLGVKAPSLYWHFPDKAALLRAVMERMFLECVEAVPQRRRWQHWMRDFAASLWRMQERTRDFGRLLLTAGLEESQVDRIEAALLQRFARLDIAPQSALRIQASVQVLVTGWFLFGHAPFAEALSSRVDFHRRMQRDLALLLDGESRRLRAPGQRRRRA